METSHNCWPKRVFNFTIPALRFQAPALHLRTPVRLPACLLTPPTQLWRTTSSPPSMISPVAANLFQSGLYVNPVNSNLQFNAYNTQGHQTRNDQGDVKVDYMPNESNHIWGRYSQGFQTIPYSNSFQLIGSNFSESPFHGAVVDWTHTFSPTMVMDARM